MDKNFIKEAQMAGIQEGIEKIALLGNILSKTKGSVNPKTLLKYLATAGLFGGAGAGLGYAGGRESLEEPIRQLASQNFALKRHLANIYGGIT